jgi:ABC-2 type transport system permease protein
VQVTLILLAALWICLTCPCTAACLLLLRRGRCCSSCANLTLGITFSSLARNQLQAMQMTLLLLPAVDPAVGLHVPLPRHAGWAQWIGEVLPLTHFLRIVRGIMLKA